MPAREQESYGYSDGFGREVMTKAEAEPGLAPIRDEQGALILEPNGALRTEHVDTRWIGSGRTVFDNKGNPVKKYEPFFSSTHEYEDEAELVETGVTPVLHYDPLGRLVHTQFPDGSHTRVVFDAWREESWDQNDTVEGTPWLAQHQGGSDEEKRAARLALAHAGTFAVAHLDTLGRTFLAVADNGHRGKNATRIELDIEGNQLSITDARGVVVARQRYDMLSRSVLTDSPDAGERRTLIGVGSALIRRWDSRGQVFRHEYDALRRATHLYVSQPTRSEFLAEHIIYGEAAAKPEFKNLKTRPAVVFDGAGVAQDLAFDFKGNAIAVTRRLAKQFTDSPDWAAVVSGSVDGALEAAQPLLEDDSFESSTDFDALGRVQSSTAPDGSVTRPQYNEANLLERVAVNLHGAVVADDFVEKVEYNARGQRERIVYGNGTQTTYGYDPQTFRMTKLRTQRESDGRVLQDLRYSFDAVGNIVAVRDLSQQDVYFGGQVVSANGAYEYDALYQLTLSEGREHPGQQPTAGDPVLGGVPHANDHQALRRYRQRYEYDAVGNILGMVHEALGGGAGWNRRYEYASDGNRLLGTSAPGDQPGQFSDTYDHDSHGNMTRMPHLASMAWDHGDRLQSVGKGGGGDVHFAYDSSGTRVRKVYNHGGTTEERVYIGTFELYRKRRGGTLEMKRETLHVNDDARRVAMVETALVDTAKGPSFAITSRKRFQLDNHLASAAVETDDSGQVITFEEYFPFGGTAFHSAASGTEVSRKRYRYTGKERDEETGLYYHGARYYAPWIGRWAASDPEGFVDGLNLFKYAHNSPIVLSDPTGTEAEASTPPKEDPPLVIPMESGGHVTFHPDGRREFTIPEVTIVGRTPESVRAVGREHAESAHVWSTWTLPLLVEANITRAGMLPGDAIAHAERTMQAQMDKQADYADDLRADPELFEAYIEGVESYEGSSEQRAIYAVDFLAIGGSLAKLFSGKAKKLRFKSIRDLGKSIRRKFGRLISKLKKLGKPKVLFEEGADGMPGWVAMAKDGVNGIGADRVIKHGDDLILTNFSVSAKGNKRALIGPVKQLLELAKKNKAKFLQLRGSIVDKDLAESLGMQVNDKFKFTVEATREGLLDLMRKLR